MTVLATREKPRGENRHDDHGRAPYRSPEHALETAYRLESQSVVKVSSLITSMLGRSIRTSRSAGELTPLDLHAQAAMVLAFVHRILSVEEMVVVRAHYTVPEIQYLDTRKSIDAMILFCQQAIDTKGGPTIDRSYAIDSIRTWCGYRPEMSEREWAARLKVSERTLRWWRNGMRGRAWQGFILPLTMRLDLATAKVAGPMYEAGLTRA